MSEYLLPPPPLKVILLGSRELAILTLDALLGRRDLAEVVAVVAADDSLYDFAKDKDPSLNLMRVDDVNSDFFLSKVEELGAELLVNVVFLQRYRSKLLSTPRFGAVNVHPSKLPYYRGRDCIRWAMINGEIEIGVTVHQMDEFYDTGEILLQRTISISPEDNFEQVRERVKPFYPTLVLETIRGLLDGTIERREQQLDEGTYFPHIAPEEATIDWSADSIDIHNLIRACHEPGFYAFTFLDGKKLYVTNSSLKPRNDYGALRTGRSQRIGRVLDFDGTDETRPSVLVGTGNGIIRIEQCGFEGKEHDKATRVLRRGVKLG